MSKLDAPNWETWASRRASPIWQAVFLATGIEPNARNWSAAEVEGSRFADGGFLPLPAPVIDLLNRAEKAVSAGTLRLAARRADPAPLQAPLWLEGEVNLSEFTAWAQRVGHKLPDGYPWRPPSLNPNSLVWPWGAYSTRDLALLAGAAERFWARYDPREQDTAPTEKVVVDWLVAQGMTDRKAKVVASILRADDLPVGRRPKQ